MEKQSWLIKLIDFLLSPFAHKEQKISVFENGEWVRKEVDNPISFSELNEQYGDNWRL